MNVAAAAVVARTAAKFALALKAAVTRHICTHHYVHQITSTTVQGVVSSMMIP